MFNHFKKLESIQRVWTSAKDFRVLFLAVSKSRSRDKESFKRFPDPGTLDLIHNPELQIATII